MGVLGVLSSGRVWEVVEGRTSAVPEGRGKHYILHFPGDPPRQEVPASDLREGLGLAIELGEQLSQPICPGRYRLEYNGPRAGSQQHFHVHIICVAEDFKIRRCVDPIGA